MGVAQPPMDMERMLHQVCITITIAFTVTQFAFYITDHQSYSLPITISTTITIAMTNSITNMCINMLVLTYERVASGVT